MLRRTVLAAFLATAGCGSNAVLSPSQHAAEDPALLALDWMALISDVIRTERITPPLASRIYAYTSIAIYEGARRGDPAQRTLAGQVNGLASLPEPTADPHDWLEVANRAVLVVAQSAFDESYLANSTTTATSRASLNGVEQAWNERRRVAVGDVVFQRSRDYGQALGDAIVAWKNADGYTAHHNAPYTPPIGAGLWAPTPPFYARALEPEWGSLRTFVLRDSDECAPPPPTPFSTDPGSVFFAEAREVYDTVNGLTNLQKEIALFWSDDPGITATPPGHWISIASQIAARDGLALERTAEAFVRVGLAVADGFLACWRGKYIHNLVRPVTYIRDTIDADWLPLLGTPPFPEYTSGHSVQSGAAAVVLTDLFGNRSFVDTTHEARGLPPRAFFNFLDAAEEAAISRLYGGIHYRPAIDRGVDQGMCIGQAIIERVQFREVS